MDDCLWPKLDRATPLLPAPDQVLLLSTSIDLSPDRLVQLRATFSPHEHKRNARFAFDELRNRWSAGRGLLRELLAAATGGKPAAIRFTYGEHGKPKLDPNSVPAIDGPELTFNVSHSRGRAMYALARGREVGVDLEGMRLRRTDDLADRYYAKQESAALREISNDDDRQRGFFYIWSGKEAFIKATGAGLSQSLSSFRFELKQIPPPPGCEGTTLLAPVAVLEHKGDPDAHARWSVHPVSPARDFSGALIVEGTPREVILRSWDSSLSLV